MAHYVKHIINQNVFLVGYADDIGWHAKEWIPGRDHQHCPMICCNSKTKKGLLQALVNYEPDDLPRAM